MDAIKAVSKRAIKKTAEGTGDLIGNKIPDIITNISRKSPTELHLKNNDSNSKIEVPKKDTCLQKKGSKLFMN